MSTIKTNRFYPTPASVTYYIGDILIDDMFRVDFQRKVDHQPVWGYDSQTYDFVARGKEIVSGSIIINYRYPGYLKAAIQRYYENKNKTNQIVNNNIMGEEEVAYDPTFFRTLDKLDLENKVKVLGNQLIKNNRTTVAMVSKLKENMRKLYGANGTTAEEADGSTEFYQSILDQKQIYQFDLSVRYGFQNVTGGYIRRFKDCVIIGESETVNAAAGLGGDLSSSAQPILEVYSFFAKTIEVIKSN